jgi:hypothetical protein
MIIDCEGCAMRELACGECVVTFLLGPPAELGSVEQTALAVLADGGLVPPLRMRPSGGGAASGTRHGPSPDRGRRRGTASA